MLESLVALIVDESKWLTASMAVALLAVTVLLRLRHGMRVPSRLRISAAMNLFWGVTIGIMACGHLLAITTKLLVGSLVGSTAAFYAIGVALAVPSWWLVHYTWRMFTSTDVPGRMTLILNGWLATTILVLGIHNLALAVPALCNIGHQLHSRRLVGWAMVSLAVVVNLALFIGSLVFLVSGRSFEQFSGLG